MSGQVGQGAAGIDLELLDAKGAAQVMVDVLEMVAQAE